MQWISADIVFDGSNTQDSFFVLVDDVGKIMKTTNSRPNEAVRHFSGLLMPGMVNAHCHLELSHLHQKLPAQTGLPAFLQNVFAYNKKVVPTDELEVEMGKADILMHQNGISVVGDICNSTISIKSKQSSVLYFHSFIESICIQDSEVENRMIQYTSILKEFEKNGLDCSLALHAPYTCSTELYKKVGSLSDFISIHNQETQAEIELFFSRSGDFLDFYKHFGTDFNSILIPEKVESSLAHSLGLLPSSTKKLFIHNTFTSANDLTLTDTNCYWCFCPKANLYIENTLPNIPMFLNQKDRIVLGTDSLASNDSLSIVSEIFTIQQAFPSIPLEDLLVWSTSNGAKLFNKENEFGYLKVGMQPGIVHLPNINVSKKKLKDDQVFRIY